MLHQFTIPPICVTRTALLILLNLIILLIFSEEYKLLNSSLCSFLEAPVKYLPLRFKYSLQFLVPWQNRLFP